MNHGSVYREPHHWLLKTPRKGRLGWTDMGCKRERSGFEEGICRNDESSQTSHVKKMWRRGSTTASGQITSGATN
jgi:hypothetical protein